ncbi:MAG: hypothetical protein BGO78_10615 [Chloroflexi bacterium 44-23]|nr:MAG: hypothetical protein BGO78_10615 [Chloroflexi bacterium 44-23]
MVTVRLSHQSALDLIIAFERIYRDSQIYYWLFIHLEINVAIFPACTSFPMWGQGWSLPVGSRPGLIIAFGWIHDASQSCWWIVIHGYIP